MRAIRAAARSGGASAHRAALLALVSVAVACESADVGRCGDDPGAPECDAGAVDAGVCELMPNLPYCVCSTTPNHPICREDAGREDSGPPERDSGPRDSGTLDRDSGPLDAGTPARDSGPLDAGTLARDSGSMDSGPVDRDSGPGDSGTVDSGAEAGSSCVPGTTAGCSSGLHCVLVFGEGDGGVAATRCVETGPLIIGAACSPERPGCLTGFQCTENRMGNDVCMHICRSTADCGGALRCVPAPQHGWAHVDGMTYGVCMFP